MKTLELQFLSEDQKTVRVSIEDPIEPIDTAKIKDAMSNVLSSQVLVGSAGLPLTSMKGARLIEQNITNYTIEG
ncbi:DUF2922 domain-containing protein [Heyndrickxia ginsengihumi]|uniref:DUF2922 domain-containing protein n=1 Tax=Heyndrickxia ginsengihumi TaxID=363870 RepID=A0A0A6VAV9_9BACI|nr:DUF2922 domain-containing protein [Heyndrickxia ginsengihumi]KHD84638.1 hypothetical protein NG54_14225 [Heyndrickxia ginsengihumi]MBE6183374.1 DUF2922 domain-containing protein [Bacillus sp. (in: firmicutes)]MCM3025087.1 DUF2922 domain-containing protein [Heyndrickxia ginsengihumi]NEY19125.1 DUF2922 domain-containing protein [Heyndrickxia ginsengihumi]